MATILTGVQSSGRVHLGNILGAILPAIELGNTQENSYFFIADLHSLTSLKNSKQLQENILQVATAWIACGLSVEKSVFFRQSDVVEHTEMQWYLQCFAPYAMLANAHSFKDKSENLASVNAGVFTYPVLMAADILLYDANFVPVGKDQKQHLEITRDIAGTINHTLGDIFVLPEPIIAENVMTIPGIDGRKMSKSYDNYIDIFSEEKLLRKKIMSIVTDSLPVEAPKNPDTCTIFSLFRSIADSAEAELLRQQYLSGGMGYGKAKELLFEAILTRFATERTKFQELIKHPKYIEEQLLGGASKAQPKAREVLNRIRAKLGIRTR
ncbi:MAG: tryptophan--tRNA ligase [Bacteroidia bacterium]|nr:tryptophan--tRNA ligase [Bacteroidia bacterium]